MPLSEECQDKLKELKREVGWWQSSFHQFIESLEQMVNFCGKILNDSRSPHVCAEAAKKLFPQLNAIKQQEEISESKIGELLETTGEIRKVLRDEPGRDNSGSFYNTLHSFKNIPLAVQSHTAEAKRIIEKCIDILRETTLDSPTTELLRDLEKCNTALRDESINKSLSTIESLLIKWKSYIPSTTRRPASLPPTETFPIAQVLIIEDQLAWLETVKMAIVEAFPHLQDQIFCCRTYDEAWKVLSALKASKELPHEGVETEEQSSLGNRLMQRWVREENGLTLGAIELERQRRKRSTLVILDLGLPKDEIELEAGKSSRAWGKKLLSELRSYALNVRTILLTSHFDFIDDHQWAINHGIEPEDYIWKAEKDYKLQVQERIKEVMEQQEPGNEIEIYEDTGSLAVIDGVEVRFKQPIYFRTFSTLCRYNRWPKTCEQIVDFLMRDYAEDDFYEYYNPNNIHDHIYRIRRDIQDAFNRVGRAVYPETIVRTILHPSEEVKYQVRREAKIRHWEDSQLASSPCSVLVVENDVERWAKPIAAFLQEDLEYEVEIATNVEEAVEKAKEFLPPILCLDMHLPENREEWGRNPLNGSDEAGLEALVRIYSELDASDFGIVVLTDLYDKDSLRAAAIQQGIDINHWIAKDANWKTNLAFAVWRLTREFKLGIKAPVDEAENMLLIRLEKSTPRVVWVDYMAVKLSVNRSKLMWALAGKNNIPVSRRELLIAVYGKDFNAWPDRERSALNSLINDTRKCIEQSLGKAGKQIDSKKVIVEAGEGYMLRGLVSIQE